MQRLAMPEAWQQWERNPLSACALCVHGRGPQERRLCAFAPEGHARVHLVAVADARRLGGHCGPEAEHLDFPGLRP